MTHAQLEDLLGARMREVTRQLFQDHLTLRARDEVRREEVVDSAGVGRSRIERGRRRRLATVFGKVTVARIAYRGGRVAHLHPADAVLNLPERMHSHGLARLAAIESSRGSFADACERINAVTGAGIGHRQVQELAVSAAADIDAFYDALVPAPCTDATPLVLSVDGKGVVIRPEALREDTAKAAAAKGGNAMKNPAGVRGETRQETDGRPGSRLRCRARAAHSRRHHRRPRPAGRRPRRGARAPPGAEGPVEVVVRFGARHRRAGGVRRVRPGRAPRPRAPPSLGRPGRRGPPPD